MEAIPGFRAVSSPSSGCALPSQLRTDLGACSGIWDRTRVAALARPSFLTEDARKRTRTNAGRARDDKDRAMSTTKNDRYAKELASAWNLSLNAARDIRFKQVASGAPSVNDLMPELLRHFDHKLRDFGSLCLGVRPLPSRVVFDRWTVLATDHTPSVDALVATRLFEGGPVFADTGEGNIGVGISGGANSGKTTMLHALIEQGAVVTSPHDTVLAVVAAPDAPIFTRIAHLGDRVLRLTPGNLDLGSAERPKYGKPEKTLLIFIDDADLILAGDERTWQFVENWTANIERRRARVFYAAATAAPRVLPRGLLSASQHVNLRGGTLPNAPVPRDDWMFCTSGHGEFGLCMSDLPAGNSPNVPDDPYRLAEGSIMPGDLVTRAGVFDADGPLPMGVQIDVPGISEEGRELESYYGSGVFTYDMRSMVNPNADAIAMLSDDISKAAQRSDFTGFHTGDNPQSTLSEIRKNRFPRPIVRSAPGLFLAEDPNIWTYNNR